VIETGLKRLVRVREDSILAGVCGGFGQYFNLDSALVRLLWVFFTIFGGSGILAYLVAIFIIPDEKTTKDVTPRRLIDGFNDKTILWGVLLVLVGIILFFQHGDFINFIWSHFWSSSINILLALIIIGVGVYVLYHERQKISSMFGGLGSEMPFSLSEKDKQLAGICGGIAKSIGMDSTIIRFFWMCGIIMSVGIGLILYFILALVLPNKYSEVSQNE
jgi:phage shock protein C